MKLFNILFSSLKTEGILSDSSKDKRRIPVNYSVPAIIMLEQFVKVAPVTDGMRRVG